MKMDEEEARTKWCPFADGTGNANCLASGCMAWRWAYSPKNVQSHPVTQTPVRTNEGYCGLAGVPRGAA